MISLESVSFTHSEGAEAVLRDVDLEIGEGELAVVAGATGSGKSTLLGLLNGIVPHFTGGALQGRVRVDGRDTSVHRPRQMAEVVGWVGQDPVAGFVTDTVEEELAYAMEQLGLAPAVMRRRVEETLDLLGIAELRDRPLATLSAGQAQRVAVGSVLTAHPRVLVLDEPTSALDPTGAEDVLATLDRLVHDVGLTVVVAEHRLDRVLHHADSVVLLPGDGTLLMGPPAVVLAASRLAPPVMQLSRLAGWHPPAVSVRQARRRAGELRTRLAGATSPRSRPDPSGATIWQIRDLEVTYPPVTALRGVDLDLFGGEVTAIMGRNGAGKSSLLWAIHSPSVRSRGSVTRRGAGWEGQRAVLVPHTPGDLLYLTTVGEECAQADADSGAEPGTCARLLAELGLAVASSTHPRDLSEGQRLGLVLAIQLTSQPELVLLDEPTRGLDPPAKAGLVRALELLAAQGRSVVLATHDVELAASVAHRVVVLAEGEVVVDGPVAEVVCSSPPFAPQVAKVLAPDPWLTVDEVAAALAGREAGR